MKHKINLCCLFAITLLFQNCIGDAYNKDLNAGYYLLAIDVKEDMSLGFQDKGSGFGIIEPTIFAVGQNDKFIIVKQHPQVSPNRINKKITNYFIIPLIEKFSKFPDKNIYGPLNLEEFKQKKEILNIKNLNFTIVFKDLE